MAPNYKIVKTESFDPNKLTFEEDSVRTIKLGNATMNKIPIKYDGGDLVLQTPVFKTCKVKTFDKKKDNDRPAIVMYQSIAYEDEEEYAHKVIEAISKKVQAHVKANVRNYFNRKKDNMNDITFNTHIQEPEDYNASIKTTVPMAVKGGKPCPTKDVNFYRGGSEELTHEEMADILEECKDGVSARALVAVPYAYTLNLKQFGFKTFLKTLDLCEKDEDAKMLEGAKVTEDTGASRDEALGMAFV